MADRCSAEDLAQLFSRHRAVHPYGLADLEEPIWGGSRWWRRGDATVGLIDLPASSDAVVYAISAADPSGTLDLLAELAVSELPARLVVTGPCGLASRLAATHDAPWSAPHHKLALADPGALPPPDDRVVPLDRRHLDDLQALLDSDPHAGDFFHAGLLDSGHYRGVHHDGRLVAAAGVHVVSRRHGVAAIGNVVTSAGHRRRGLGRAVVAAVARRLLDEVDVVGLNVEAANTGARLLYESLGFSVVLDYDEASLVRRCG